MRLDQMLRFPEGYTLKEILMDEDIDDIGERQLRNDLDEIATVYGAEYVEDMYRGRARLWRYKDINFSIYKQLSADLEIIRKTIDKLSLFKGNPRFDLLRFYLIGLAKGESEERLSNSMSFDNNIDVKGLDYIETILDAIVNRYPLKMSYQPFGKEKMRINLHPYHLKQYNRRWFLFGLVEGEDKVLNYAVDRITKLEHLSKPYIDTDIDFDSYLDDIVGVSNYANSNVQRILLKVANKSVDYIRTKPIHSSQKELKDRREEDFSYFELNLKVNTELKMLLFSYSDAIEVIQPRWLRNFFAGRIETMSEIYGANHSQ